MLAYVVRRLFVAIPIVIVSSFVTFVAVALSGNPLSEMLYRNPPAPDSAIQEVTERLHLDKPVLERYWIWLTGVLRGDFGPSVRPTMQIGPELMDRWLITIRLIAVAMVLALVLAVVVGVISAIRQYSGLDYTLTFTGFLFLAMPPFWLAILLKQVATDINQAVDAQIFFTIGSSSVFVEGGGWERFLDTLGHMILPSISLALLSYAAWSRFQRAAMLEVLGSDYVRLARAKGLSRRRVLVNHALRTALIPLTTVTAMDLGTILSGAVIVETVYQWHGMGDFLVTAIQQQDVYAVASWLLISGTTIVVLNLVADLLYAVLDPRIRHA